MAADIDLPILPSAAQIRRREFASVRRGYDPDQVRHYLGQVAEQLKGLEQQLQEARLQAGSSESPPTGPPPSEDPYERLAKRLTTLLATADREAEGILSEARADAARMIGEARTEADRIRVDAQSHAEEARQEGNDLLERAKQEADRVVVGLSARRENLVQQLQDMQSRLIGVAKELEVAIDDPMPVSKPAPAGQPVAEVAPSSGTAAQAAEGSAPSSDPPASAPAATEHHEEAEGGHASDQGDTVDSLEGMLADDGLDLPDMQSLELDFDDDSSET
jgi:DivIVA domain-containing protein